MCREDLKDKNVRVVTYNQYLQVGVFVVILVSYIMTLKPQYTPSWRNGLTHHPFTVAFTGSNPVLGTKQINIYNTTQFNKFNSIYEYPSVEGLHLAWKPICKDEAAKLCDSADFVCNVILVTNYYKEETSISQVVVQNIYLFRREFLSRPQQTLLWRTI